MRPGALEADGYELEELGEVMMSPLTWLMKRDGTLRIRLFEVMNAMLTPADATADHIVVIVMGTDGKPRWYPAEYRGGRMVACREPLHAGIACAAVLGRLRERVPGLDDQVETALREMN
jgi:hypothetical protein